jgi:hypothetical protein
MHRPITTPADDGLIGWELVRLRYLASDASALCARIEQKLSGIDLDTLRTNSSLVISAETSRDTVDTVLALHDLAEEMERIAASLRIRDGTLVVPATAVELEAAAALRQGSADPASVMLTVRMLRPRDGFAALAEAIEGDPTITEHWNELTLGELLAAFRDSDPETLARVCEPVDINPGVAWAQLTHDQRDQLVHALRAAAND